VPEGIGQSRQHEFRFHSDGIWAMIEMLSFASSSFPNSFVRLIALMSASETSTIGLIIPDVVNPFFSPVVRGAELTARKAGYRILLCNTEGDLRLERDYIEDLVAHRVEGLTAGTGKRRNLATASSIAPPRLSDRAARSRPARPRL